MSTISVCMIVKNEEQYLQQCLESIKSFADEIIIINTGSTDKTKEIAQQYTDKIYDFIWINDFSAARNFSLSKATKEWIFVIDADEFIMFNPKDILVEFKNKELLAFSFLQRNYTNNTTIPSFHSIQEDKEHIPEFLQKQFKGFSERPFIKLFKNIPQLRYKYLIHEQLDGIADTKQQVAATNYIVHHIGFDANLLESKKQYYLKLAEKQLSVYPNNTTVLFNLAMAYADNKQMAKSVDVLHTIYRQNKDFPNIVRVLSDFLVKIHRIAESQQLLVEHIQYLQFQQEIDTKELSYLYYILGIVYSQQQLSDKSIDCFQKSNTYLANADAYNGLAMIAVGKKQYQEAYEFLQKAFALNPNNIHVTNNMKKLGSML
ncbi:glycosyltransferase [Candidatus Woesearchaeota archaeon]|nr:glycosyltransferase [Candidatus Woesearchaeota archaeon]